MRPAEVRVGGGDEADGPVGAQDLEREDGPSSALFTFQSVITPFAGETTGLVLVAGSNESWTLSVRPSADPAVVAADERAAEDDRVGGGRGGGLPTAAAA